MANASARRCHNSHSLLTGLLIGLDRILAQISHQTNGPSKSNLLFMVSVSVLVSVSLVPALPPLDTWHPSELFIYLFARFGLKQKEKKNLCSFFICQPLELRQLCPDSLKFSLSTEEDVCLFECVGQIAKKKRKRKSLRVFLLPGTRSLIFGAPLDFPPILLMLRIMPISI